MSPAEALEAAEAALEREDAPAAVRALAAYQKARRGGAEEPQEASNGWPTGDWLARLLQREAAQQLFRRMKPEHGQEDARP